ncbi:hypothetical protein [Pelosinus propionicus]|uniref:Uncharacterized protein n=1 Tax=Pelosinus propionicus DSM 13327 TaxID=1123291 RepID=A0A1I4N2Z8_9FIRM|nr:hypothetical protein [Pelosinus propionicus]SFM09706.1 hypothetical protein SAMN04490355_104060 [Pelosinus propionicus DSM 13327]
MQFDLFAPVELKDIRRDLKYWQDTADKMARNYPKYQYAVVEDMFGSYVCMPITEKFDREIVYQTEGGICC